jgi:hypothetical protein
MLNEFDLDIAWYAIATGVEGKSQDEREQIPLSPYDGARLPDLSPLSAFDGAWGLPEFSMNMLRQHNQDFRDDSALREEYFLESMKFLVENESIAKRLYQGNPRDLLLKERYQYIKDNGIQVYGVVVTGPTKELLKLQQLETVHSPALGDVKLWNWFHRYIQVLINPFQQLQKVYDITGIHIVGMGTYVFFAFGRRDMDLGG